MKKIISVFRYFQPSLIAIVCFILLFTATISYTNYKHGLWEKDIRANLLDVLIGKKSKLEKALYSRIYYTRGVAAFVALKPEITNEEFQELAREYIKGDTVISTMALSKNCIINTIYPLKGHEAALGLNLLEHPERKYIVEKTIQTHQTFIAGPVELIEGGRAFISYTPIFEKKKAQEGSFWGVTDIVILQKNLFQEANFKTEEGSFEFALRGYNGMGEKGDIFWGNPKVFENNPVHIIIDLPIGSWILAAKPIAGWNIFPDQDKAISLILIISSLIISILIWLFTQSLVKIKHNERELKAIFGSMDNLIIEFNRQGKYIKIAPTNSNLLFKSKDELIGKTLAEVFDKKIATYFMEAIQKCLNTKQVVVIEYPLDIQGKETWFTARINYKNENSVIYNAYDVTDKKNDEEVIHQSEIRLKELNGIKDKFFSILAHDLRNPVGSQKMMIDLIVEDYEKMEESVRKELLWSMQESAAGLFTLLEELLEWSRSQSEKMVIKSQSIDLHEFCKNLTVPFLANARLKNIRIENNIPENKWIVSDADIIGTILRNLISNAIKFTNHGGNIQLALEETNRNNQKYLDIRITDNGIGISPEKVGLLFQFGMVASTYGTDLEKGYGLGLSLCKELATKIGGTISVVSTPNQGSTFTLSLPTN